MTTTTTTTTTRRLPSHPDGRHHRLTPTRLYRFFCADLIIAIIVTPNAIAGASLWKNVANAEDDGSQGISAFRGSVVLCWLIFLITAICGVQDYVAAKNDSGLLN